MGPGVGPRRRGPVPEGCMMKSIMTALAPLESRHPRLGQSLWWLWVMRPQCLHAHAAPLCSSRETKGAEVCVPEGYTRTRH